MSLESLISDSGQSAAISAEAADGQVPAQTALGGADRSDAGWVTVATAVPCLVRPRSSTLAAFDARRNDARANVVDATIYFAGDAIAALGIPLSTRQRITVTTAPGTDPTVAGVYSVQGAINPNAMGRIYQVDCERIRTP